MGRTGFIVVFVLAILALIAVSILIISQMKGEEDIFEDEVLNEQEILGEQEPLNAGIGVIKDDSWDYVNEQGIPEICASEFHSCNDFSTQEQAQEIFEFCLESAGDVHNLDEDNNNMACDGFDY